MTGQGDTIDLRGSQGAIVGAAGTITQTFGYSADQVSVLLAEIRSSFQPKPFDGRSPYVGLDAFDEQDAGRFFGREKLVVDLVARVSESRFIVVAGPSGSGKSSLVRAGLMHALRQGALPGSDRWLYTALKPGRNPIEQLALAIARMARSPDAGEYLRRNALNDADALHKAVETALSDRADQRALLLVDQFEETFTQVGQESERAAFLNLLVRATTLENGRTTILVTLRSDFVSNCARYPQLNALLNRQFIQVGAMLPDELVSAIARPALQVGLRIDPDLIAQIVNDMKDEPGMLPLMQFTLKDLFDAQQAAGGVIALTQADYLARGGLRKSLERHADQAFGQLSGPEQAIAREVFKGLIQPGRGAQDTRRTALLDELTPADTGAEAVRAVVHKLASARLITTDEQGEKDTATIAHEKLIEAWPWLRRLVDENREVIALQNQINEDAQTWEQNRRDASYLYTGARLETAREKLAAQKLTLGALASAFLQESIKAKDAAVRRSRRLTQAVVGATAAAALIFAVLAGWAVLAQDAARRSEADAIDARGTAVSENHARATQEAIAIANAQSKATAEAVAQQERDTAVQQRNLANSRELATQADSELVRGNVERAILIALEANRSAHTFQSEEALRRALLDSEYLLRPPLVWSMTMGFFRNVQFAPDGKHMLAHNDDSAAFWWDIETGESREIRQAFGRCAQLSPDGRSLVIGDVSGHLTLVDVAADETIGEFQGVIEPLDLPNCVIEPGSVQFSPDGRFIMSMSNYSRTVQLWDVAARRLLHTLDHNHGYLHMAQFSPDGAALLTAHDDAAVLWELASGRPVTTFGGYAGALRSARFSPDGQWVVTAGRNDVRIWEVKTGRMARQLKSPGGVSDARFSPGVETVLTASHVDPPAIWDAATGEKIADLQGSRGDTGFIELGYSHDGRRIVAAGDDGAVRVWGAFTGNLLAILSGDTAGLRSAQFTPDDRFLVAVTNDGDARIWAVHDPGRVLIGHTGEVPFARFSQDGLRIVTRGADQTARIWDVLSGREIARLSLGRDADVDLAGQRIGIVSDEQTVHIQSLDASGQAVTLPEAGILAVALSPDGMIAATVSEEMIVRQWDATTGRAMPVTIRLGRAERFKDLWFPPDGKRIVTTGSRVVDAGTRRQRVVSVAHHWDAATGQALPDSDLDTGVSVPAGRQSIPAPSGALSVTLDGNNAKLVNLADGSDLAILRGHTAPVIHAEFSPDGRNVVTASQDGTARIHLVRLDDLVALAKSRVTRELTCQERMAYLHAGACSTPEPGG